MSLCGCVTTGRNETARAEKLPAEKPGTVLMHTSMHDEHCITVTGTLAQPDASGRYVRVKEVTLKGPHDFEYAHQKIPNRIVLPPGDYGFAQFKCAEARTTRALAAPIVQRGSVFDGSGTVYARPIVAFTVGPGEVVDIGSVLLPKHTPYRRDVMGEKYESNYVPVIKPIPPSWLENLAATDAALHRARVVRPMTVLGPRQAANAAPVR